MARMYDWQAPAKLFFWPAEDGSDEETIFDTLGEALRAAGDGDLASAWIITRDGDILNPRIIEALRSEPAPKARRTGFSFFGRARAA